MSEAIGVHRRSSPFALRATADTSAVAPRVPFVDLDRIHRPLEAQFHALLAGALERSAFVGGPAVERFERDWADYVGAPFCVAVSSGTAALELALRAAVEGPAAGASALTVPNSFFATAEAILGARLVPEFVDVDPVSQLLDPAALVAAVTDVMRAIVPVHLFGQPCDLEPIWDLAESRRLAVIEDACQAHGAEYGARRVGGSPRSAAACWSFYPGKNLGALGDAGAVTTHDAEICARVRQLRDHGSALKYRLGRVGTNARMDALHEATHADLADLAEGSSFHRVLRDDAETRKGDAVKLAKDAKIRRVILCSGKVYYDLYEEREKRGMDDVYLLRVEQLYPFPLKSMATILARFKGADIVWCQEEPKNMGSWSFVEPYLEWVLGHCGAKSKRARYVGRPASAATATGLMSKHLHQLKAFLDEAFAA
jgi:hypothetical protein